MPHAPAAFAVVVPAYQAAAFIDETLESLRRQTHAPREVIVVDDGSTDDTAVRARRFAASVPWPVAVIVQSNAGISAARNRAIRSASSPWIALLDADDLWTPDHLAQLARAADAACDASLVFGGGQLFHDTPRGRVLEPVPVAQKVRQALDADAQRPADDLLPLTPEGAYALLTPGVFFPTSGAAFRRILGDDLALFDPVLATSEDRDLFLRCAKAGRCVCVDRPITLTRVHAQSITARPRSLTVPRSAVQCAEKWLAMPSPWPLTQAERLRWQAVRRQAFESLLYAASRQGLAALGAVAREFEALHRATPLPRALRHWSRAALASAREVLR